MSEATQLVLVLAFFAAWYGFVRYLEWRRQIEDRRLRRMRRRNLA